MKIPTRQVVEDIRSGIGDEELMAKYELSSKHFQRLLLRLVGKKAIDHKQLYDLSETYRYMADVWMARRDPRIHIPVAIHVYREGSALKGYIRDISEHGLRIAGFEATVGETVTLYMPLREFPAIGPIRFDAVCRWSESKGEHNRFVVSGYEIVSCPDEVRSRVRELIDHFDCRTNAGEPTLPVEFRPIDIAACLPQTDLLCKSREFSGTIEGIDILELLQFMILTRQDKVLHIRSCDGHDCRLHLAKGKIVHASSENLEGTEAFFACTEFSGGQFLVQPWQDPGRYSIFEPPDFLLMEAARRRDESMQRIARPNREDATVQIDEPLRRLA